MNINLNFKVNDFDSNNNLFKKIINNFSLIYLFNLIKDRTAILQREKNIKIS